MTSSMEKRREIIRFTRIGTPFVQGAVYVGTVGGEANIYFRSYDIIYIATVTDVVED